MKKSIMTGLIVLTILLVGLDWQKIISRKTEINLLQPAVIIGIDSSDEIQKGALVTLLLSESDVNSKDGGDGASGVFSVKTSQAVTVAEAIEKIEKTSFKEIPAGSIEYFLLGEKAFQSDLPFFTDLLSKDQELRLISNIYFVSGSNAKDVLTVVSKENNIDIFETFGENSGVTATSSDMKFTEYLQNISEDLSFAVPTVQVVKEEEKDNILPDGYAIIGKGVFKGYIKGSLARGYNIITNKPAQSVINIQVGNNQNASLMLENASTKMNFTFAGNQLTHINIYTDLKSDVLDMGAIKDIRDETARQDAENKQSDVIRNEIENIITLSQEMGMDFLGISQQLRLHHPYKWARIEKNWSDIFVKVKVNIYINSRIQRAFDVIKLDNK